MTQDPAQRYATTADMQADLHNCRPEVQLRSIRKATSATNGHGTINAGAGAKTHHSAQNCSICGSANRVDARFCRRCGHSFVGTLPTRLRILQPKNVTWEMPINTGKMLIGRRSKPEGLIPDLDLDFYDPEGFVSRRHAQITHQKTQYLVIDLDSDNGTYINNTRLVEASPHILRNGDRIQVGKIVLEFAMR